MTSIFPFNVGHFLLSLAFADDSALWCDPELYLVTFGLLSGVGLNPGRPCLTLDSFGSIPNSGQQRLACSNLVFLHQLGKYFENLLQRALLQM